MPSMMIDETVLDRARKRVDRPQQRELDDDEPEDNRVYTLEDEFDAGEALLAAMRTHRLAKEATKAAKLDEEAAVEEWRRVHIQVRLGRRRGQW